MRADHTEEMRRKPTWVLMVVSLLAAGFVILKLTVPFAYTEADLRSQAIEYVQDLQGSSGIDPKECAARYLYFDTDYHSVTPDRIRTSEKEIAENQIRITLHDPSCRDDSIHSSVDRIYLERKNDGIWVPIRHECAHTGRGKFGWTTAPTN